MLRHLLLISSTFIVFSSFCSTIQAAQSHSTQRAVTRERVHALDRLLAEARASGHLPPKVHVYGHSLGEKPYYEDVIRKYYPHSNALLFTVVPEVYAPAYVERLRENAVNDFIFWGDLPPSYPPFWEPIWDPFFRGYHHWGIHENYRPHRHHNAHIQPRGIERHHRNRSLSPHRSAAITHPSHVHTPHAHRHIQTRITVTITREAIDGNHLKPFLL